MPSLIPRLAAALAPTLDFMVDREMAAMLDDPEVANFAVGNPQRPLECFRNTPDIRLTRKYFLGMH